MRREAERTGNEGDSEQETREQEQGRVRRGRAHHDRVGVAVDDGGVELLLHHTGGGFDHLLPDRRDRGCDGEARQHPAPCPRVWYVVRGRGGGDGGGAERERVSTHAHAHARTHTHTHEFIYSSIPRPAPSTAAVLLLQVGIIYCRLGLHMSPIRVWVVASGLGFMPGGFCTMIPTTEWLPHPARRHPWRYARAHTPLGWA